MVCKTEVGSRRAEQQLLIRLSRWDRSCGSDGASCTRRRGIRVTREKADIGGTRYGQSGSGAAMATAVAIEAIAGTEGAMGV